VAMAPPVGAHADALDIAGPQRPATVQQPSLDDRRVTDELAVFPGQRMHAAQRVLPVLVGEVAVKGLVEQRTGRREGGAIEVGGVGGADRGGYV
jgi:hypothetical protein